ncbi:MAG TPA: cytochrome P450, partial [Mycobacterium sp.]|nr:cytochrome P450 [Mycobacterium sp.]
MATISTPEYLLDQAKRRLTPSFNNFPGMGAAERRLLRTEFPPKKLAEPPPGSGLKPVMGDAGLPVLGHMIEMLRGGPDYLMFLYHTKGPLVFEDSPVLPAVAALGPDAAQIIYSNRNKDYSQQGWVSVIGPFFHRGLMLLDFDEHMFHRRIMQEAFVRSRLVRYAKQVDQVVSQVVATDWVVNDARFLLYPAMKELTLDIASMVFMGHEPGTDRELVTKMNKAFTTVTRAGNAVIRTSVPPFTWWRGLKARELLENYFAARVRERRGKDGDDLLTVLCQSEDKEGNRFSDEDVINHMIFLMMAAHDTSTSTATTMVYHLAAHPEWQERCRDESDRLGDGPLDIESLEKLESLDLVMNESIRLVTPVQWAMRQTVRDTELLGYYLPAGTNVIAYPGMNHRLPELWTHPLQ